MQWNNKFTYPKSMRSMVSGSRMYAVNQEKLPSVTSILQATQSEEKKASLANWKARVGAVEANRIKNDASNRGTSMHAFLEKYLLGQLNLELLEEKNNKFTYPKSMRSIVSGSRMYAVNQEKLPSVTSILQATQSEEKKASLANWKARVGVTEANRIKNDASSRGTSMHSFLEKYLLGQLNLELLEEEDNKSKKMADEIIEQGIKNKLSEIWGTEATLYYPGKYAGTCDACGIYEGEETIIDFKQSNKPKKEEWIEDYYLQLGAYSLAHNVVYNSRITQGIVLLCTVDNLFQDFRIQGEKLEEYQNKFLEKVEQFYHQRNMN